MANALQFIESNIEDLEKEEVQQEIIKKYLAKIRSEQSTFSSLAKLAALYEEGNSDETHFTIDELKLVEELLS